MSRRRDPHAVTLVRSPRTGPGDGPRLARLGAYGFLPPGDDLPARLDLALGERRKGGLDRLGEAVEVPDWERLLVGASGEMRQIVHIIHLVGGRRATVLITGETGTGKEICARARAWR